MVALAFARAEAGASVAAVLGSLEADGGRASGVRVTRVPGVESSPPPSGPLAGRRVLVTRPREAAAVQRDRFESLGAEAVALPCLAIEPAEDLAAFDEYVSKVQTFDGVIVSSRAGVEAFSDSLGRVGLEASALAGVTVLAVGRSTERACRARGIRPDIVPSQPRSEGIVSELKERDLLAKRWLHVRARDGRDTVDVAVTEAGGQYTLAVGYRAECPEAPPGVIAWLRSGVDFICLHSGRTGEHLKAILEAAGIASVIEGASVVSAGPVTTEALREQGFEVAATASSPGDDGMVRAVLKMA